jgi:hypothetical protein
MNEYYTMESVRALIHGIYDVRPAVESPVPLPSWNRYPSCPRLGKCRQVVCTGYVSIFVNTETVRWLLLEICFFSERQRAFIRADNLQMRKLFELGIINDETLLTKTAF